MKEYDHNKIEKKWQKEWDTKKVYKTLSAKNAKGKKPFYVLDMFPYPSGAGLHVGHPRGYIGSDVITRKMRMQGFNVLHPMGYDAFGLPAEQYAIANKVHPRKAVEINVKTFEKQLEIIGLSYDWSRKINTTDEEYYKWTQWIFLKIYNSWFDKTKNKARPIAELIKYFAKNGNTGLQAFTNYEGIFSAKDWKMMDEHVKQSTLMHYRLAYEGNSEVNWCPHLSTVLANDEIVDSPEGPVSERGGYSVEKKSMRQWFMRITSYGDRLIKDLEGLDWPENIKEVQKNWIGKSQGSEIDFKLKIGNQSDEHKVTVFTTRADTLFGVTYIVLAPEHELVSILKNKIKNYSEVEKYLSVTKKKDEIARTGTDKEKTGVELKGVSAINPTNGEEIPVWIADYVLPNYGTGAVMAVPAHDERDFLFANKFNLPNKQVVAPHIIDVENPPRKGKENTKRNIVHVLVEHPTEDKIICLVWKDFPWKTFITGGIEEGENAVEAAIREVLEETGYKNAQYVKQLPYKIFSEFYAGHKDVNRAVLTNFIHLKLKDLDKKEVAEEEKKLHTAIWRNFSEIDTFSPVSELEHVINWMKNGDLAYCDDGVLINSGKFDFMRSDYARSEITKFVGGRLVTKYKFRDAVFARQRYWGEPIPLFKDKSGIIHEVGDKKLPLVLPNVKSYEPTGTGESPLASVASWVKGGYETNTMPGWAGSSWYFLRYLDPKNKKVFADKSELNYWFSKKNHGGVNVYVGGAEHATGHLMYSRFWHKVLFDYGLVPTPEPFGQLRNQGMILAADGRKMSKRWGNVINPDEVVKTYGADTLRLYEMFMGPFEAKLPWSTESIIGSRRFIERVWRFVQKINNQKIDKKSKSTCELILHKTIKKVTEDISNFSFNTAVSAMMICLNEMEKSEVVTLDDLKMFIQILAPFAPYVTEDIWQQLGEKKSIHLSSWPKFDEKKIVSETVKIVIQVNGKFRGTIEVKKDTSKEEIEELARNDEKVKVFMGDRNPQKVIYVPGRLINFVV